MVSLGHQSLTPTELGRVDEDMASPGNNGESPKWPSKTLVPDLLSAMAAPNADACECQVKAGNSLGSLHVPRGRTHSGQGFPWFSKALGFLGHVSTFVNVFEYNAVYSFEGLEDIRLRQLGSLLGSLVGSLIARDPT
ncbi:hypothetical protein TNCV_3524921 [Trichonephila clavipes]|uniref:Uncharacterized protein n=1 Tax=Trichonephila clavipes TaxID=2585209 RepID=A0A8X6SDU3_TRICX|nr:hypothetical protein TNCV_3524921 [Trichonephila clavipes]